MSPEKHCGAWGATSSARLRTERGRTIVWSGKGWRGGLGASGSGHARGATRRQPAAPMQVRVGKFSVSEDAVTSLSCAWRHAVRMPYRRFARFRGQARDGRTQAETAEGVSSYGPLQRDEVRSKVPADVGESDVHDTGVDSRDAGARTVATRMHRPCAERTGTPTGRAASELTTLSVLYILTASISERARRTDFPESSITV